MGEQHWQVIPQNNNVIHVAPLEDTHKHNYNVWGICWCGAWREYVGLGILVHHLNLTERIAVAGNAERIA